MEILALGSTGAMGIVISLVLIAFGAILAWAVNTNGGSVLWNSTFANFTTTGTLSIGNFPDYTGMRGTNANVVQAHDIAITTTGTGGIGNVSTPIQTDVIGTNNLVRGATYTFAAGTGGIFVTDWNDTDPTILGAIADGGDIQIVAANGGGGGGSTARGCTGSLSGDPACGGTASAVGGAGSSAIGASGANGGLPPAFAAAGGGGGGAGRIRINTTGGAANVTGTLSPGPSIGLATQGPLGT